MFVNYQIRRQATCKMGSETGDCSCHFNISQEFLLLCMGYLNTFILLPPKVKGGGGGDLVDLKTLVGKLLTILGQSRCAICVSFSDMLVAGNL